MINPFDKGLYEAPDEEYPSQDDITNLAEILLANGPIVVQDLSKELLTRFYFTSRNPNDPKNQARFFQKLTSETVRNAV